MFERKDWNLVVWPAAISLGVTLLRLVGELLNWSPALFGKAAGGGGSIVGITWLIVPFGAWFGWTLARGGSRPASTARAVALVIAGIAVVPIGATIVDRLGLVAAGSPMQLAVFVIFSLIGVVIARIGWPDLSRVLILYALAARIPVVLVMLVAMLGNWGTHYDVAPPGFPEMGVIGKWLWIGVLPQMTIWIWFTLVIGSLFGLAAAAIAKKRS